MKGRLTEPNYTYHDCEFMDDGMAPYMNRLAAYEETGLTPEAIDDLQDKCFRLDCTMEEYKAAESDGRLIVLPCKVGDTVWSGDPFADGEIREGNITVIKIDSDGFCGFWACFGFALYAEFIAEDIGKTVFPTREEAEAAMGAET